MIKKVVGLAFGATLALGGCSGTSPEVLRMDQSAVDAYLSDKPEAMHSMFRRVVSEGERNRVLNLLRAGLGAMQLGHDEVAARAFDEALLTIETIYGEDAGAASARGKFTAEDLKTFRGEPYERRWRFTIAGFST